MLTKCLVCTFLFVCFLFLFFQTIHTRKWLILCTDRLKLISMERDISVLINNYRSIFFLSISCLATRARNMYIFGDLSFILVSVGFAFVISWPVKQQKLSRSIVCPAKPIAQLSWPFGYLVFQKNVFFDLWTVFQSHWNMKCRMKSDIQFFRGIDLHSKRGM